MQLAFHHGPLSQGTAPRQPSWILRIPSGRRRKSWNARRSRVQSAVRSRL